MQAFQLTLKPSINYIVQRGKQLTKMYTELVKILAGKENLSVAELEAMVLMLENGRLIIEDLTAAFENIIRAVRRQIESKKSVSGGCGDSPVPVDGINQPSKE